MEALKPCPFCGGDAEIWRAHPENPRRHAWIACVSGCAVLTKEHPTDAEAIAVWNCRAPDPRLEEAEKALEVANATIEHVRESLRDQAAARLDPDMPLLCENVLDELEGDAEAAYACADNQHERIQAHGLMLLCEWQRRAHAAHKRLKGGTDAD